MDWFITKIFSAEDVGLKQHSLGKFEQVEKILADKNFTRVSLRK